MYETAEVVLNLEAKVQLPGEAKDRIGGIVIKTGYISDFTLALSKRQWFNNYPVSVDVAMVSGNYEDIENGTQPTRTSANSIANFRLHSQTDYQKQFLLLFVVARCIKGFFYCYNRWLHS